MAAPRYLHKIKSLHKEIFIFDLSKMLKVMNIHIQKITTCDPSKYKVDNDMLILSTCLGISTNEKKTFFDNIGL